MRIIDHQDAIKRRQKQLENLSDHDDEEIG